MEVGCQAAWKGPQESPPTNNPRSPINYEPNHRNSEDKEEDLFHGLFSSYDLGTSTLEELHYTHLPGAHPVHGSSGPLRLFIGSGSLRPSIPHSQHPSEHSVGNMEARVASLQGTGSKSPRASGRTMNHPPTRGRLDMPVPLYGISVFLDGESHGGGRTSKAKRLDCVPAALR